MVQYFFILKPPVLQKQKANFEMDLVVTEEEKNQDPNQVFELLEKFGSGSYGTVYKALHKSSGKICAIKQIPVENDLNDTIREISIMTGFESQYLVHFHASYLTDEALWIVMELCEAGSVSDVMTLCDTCLSEEMISLICYDVLNGLNYLHEKRKIHRDIKAAGEAKLGDFGVTGQLADHAAKRVTFVGTPFWMAPGVKYLIDRGDPGHFSPEFNDFVKCCLQKNPNDRLSAIELLKHPFITKNKTPENSKILQQLIDDALYRISNGFLQQESETETEDEGDEVRVFDDDENYDMTVKQNPVYHIQQANDYDDTVKPETFAALKKQQVSLPPPIDSSKEFHSQDPRAMSPTDNFRQPSPKSPTKQISSDMEQTLNLGLPFNDRPISRNIMGDTAPQSNNPVYYTQERPTSQQSRASNKSNNEPISQWPQYLQTLSKAELQDFLDMIDQSESKQKEAVYSQYQEKLKPILDGIDYKLKH
ncbi:Serine/threonine-protein kinase 4 [Boothiomyces sp. JEL0866]|nr:Serine/threonine-protein kinase 4 [Boothiomyces sp. JEL0866]KAJ3324557.1 Serine/threonine-protein kinase 4 [Boothiomyces sp. JEL0866]